MSVWFISIVNTVLIAVVLLLFYYIGRIVYRGHSRREYSFVRVLLHFFLLLLVSGVLMSILGVVQVVILGLVEFVHELVVMDESASVSIDEISKFKGGNFLLLLLVLILCTAMLQYGLRNVAYRRWWRFRLHEDDYDILEYLIQWMTIFLAVYQFMFDGMREALTFLDGTHSARSFFNIVLSPNNINLVIQPLLISSWVTVAMEKLRRKADAGPHHAVRRGEAGGEPEGI